MYQAFASWSGFYHKTQNPRSDRSYDRACCSWKRSSRTLLCEAQVAVVTCHLSSILLKEEQEEGGGGGGGGGEEEEEEEEEEEKEDGVGVRGKEEEKQKGGEGGGGGGDE